MSISAEILGFWLDKVLSKLKVYVFSILTRNKNSILGLDLRDIGVCFNKMIIYWNKIPSLLYIYKPNSLRHKSLSFKGSFLCQLYDNVNSFSYFCPNNNDASYPSIWYIRYTECLVCLVFLRNYYYLNYWLLLLIYYYFILFIIRTFLYDIIQG